MDSDEILRKMIEYGANEKEVKIRFCGNVELYGICILDFLEEPNFLLLKNAMEEGDSRKAFEAAHTIKGISGNLGLAPLYEKSCALVEILRNGEIDEKAKEEYAEILKQYEKIKKLFC